MKKTKIDLGELISLVEKNQCLWNPLLKSYRNKVLRHIAWQRISATLGIDSETIQKKWRQVRDRYKREINGTYPNKNNKPWEYAEMMTFLDPTYGDDLPSAGISSSSTKSDSVPDQPSNQLITSQPVIITVPKRQGLRPIAPKISVEETTSFSAPIVTTVPISVDMKSNFTAENKSEATAPKEPEIYLVTPTLFNDQERILFNQSLNTPVKRRAVDDDDDDDDDLEQVTFTPKSAKVTFGESEAKRRLEWEEKEHLLRVKCLEEEHKVKMEIEKAKLKVEQENMKIKEQKLKVLLIKEAYFKDLLESRKNASFDDD